jgi:hypothetical protein
VYQCETNQPPSAGSFRFKLWDRNHLLMTTVLASSVLVQAAEALGRIAVGSMSWAEKSRHQDYIYEGKTD